jgi:hypothetical protein
VLENVAPLKEATRFRSVWNYIMTSLGRLVDYSVSDMVMCTSSHGIPQNRKRLYIVGIKRPDLQFKFPKSVPPFELTTFFDLDDVQPSSSIPPTHTGARNLMQCYLDAKLNHDINALEELIVVDLDRSPSRGIHWAVDIFPCITRERGGTRGFWLSTLCRQITIDELLALQGFGEVNRADLTDRQLGLMVSDVLHNVAQAMAKCSTEHSLGGRL